MISLKQNAKHRFGLKVIVAINKFEADTQRELSLVQKIAIEAGADDAVVTTNHSEGGNGAIALSNAVIDACFSNNHSNYDYRNNSDMYNDNSDNNNNNNNNNNNDNSNNTFKYLYDIEDSIESKLENIVKNVYGGVGIELSHEAKLKINLYTKQG